MYVIVSVSVLVFPIVFLVPLQPAVSDLISGMAFAIAVLGSMSSLFAPKALLLWQGADLDAQFRIVMPTKAVDNSGKYDAALNLQSSLHAEDQFPDMEAIRSVQNKKIPREQKKDICREQMEKWQSLLMKLENKNILDDSSGGVKSSSQPTRSSAQNMSSAGTRLTTIGGHPQKEAIESYFDFKLPDVAMHKVHESPESSLDGSVRSLVPPPAKPRRSTLGRWSEKESSCLIAEGVSNNLPILSVRASESM